MYIAFRFASSFQRGNNINNTFLISHPFYAHGCYAILSAFLSNQIIDLSRPMNQRVCMSFNQSTFGRRYFSEYGYVKITFTTRVQNHYDFRFIEEVFIQENRRALRQKCKCLFYQWRSFNLSVLFMVFIVFFYRVFLYIAVFSPAK